LKKLIGKAERRVAMSWKCGKSCQSGSLSEKNEILEILESPGENFQDIKISCPFSFDISGKMMGVRRSMVTRPISR
jgi:hypothetical protein